MALHEVGKIDAHEIIVLTPKKRSLFRLLLVSALRALWVSKIRPFFEGEVLDAEYRQVQEDPSAGKADAPRDVELERVVSIFKLLRSSGYTLKIIPGTPEENAPRFDFPVEQAHRPAA